MSDHETTKREVEVLKNKVNYYGFLYKKSELFKFVASFITRRTY
jgi:hypothetical protein